jgi:DNA-binding winged helix-turn-helix (wHTH) protein
MCCLYPNQSISTNPQADNALKIIEGQKMYEWGDLRLDPEACQVSYKGNNLRLYPKEYEILKLFFDCPKQVLSPEVIIERLWYFDSAPTESAVRTHIKGLRRKLKDAGVQEIILTVHSLGYRLKPQPKEIVKSAISLSPMLMKLLSLHDIEYAIVDINLAILELSPNLKNFSDYPLDIAIDNDITLAFPELIGLEPIFLEILENKQTSFNIEGVARTTNYLRPKYINISVISQVEESSLQKLLILFEDSSEKMVLKQEFVQRQNESFLLLR